MTKSNLTLGEWIDTKGTTHIANLLDVDESTVRHWRRGHCLPRPSQMLAIKKASRGAVTVDEMITSFFKKNAGKEGI